MEIYHLAGSKRFSQRAVKVASLDDTQVALNLTNVAKKMNEETTMVELRKAEIREGLKFFVREISEPTDNPLAKDLKWTKVNALTFEEGFGTFFTPKDIQTLEAMYREYHDVTKAELDTIMGKGLVVAND